MVQMESVLAGHWTRTSGASELPSDGEARAALASCIAAPLPVSGADAPPQAADADIAPEEEDPAADTEAAEETTEDAAPVENAAAEGIAARLAQLPVPPPAGLEQQALQFTPGLNIFRIGREWYFVTRNGGGPSADDRYLKVTLDWNPTPQGLRIRVVQTDAWLDFAGEWQWASREGADRETYAGVWGELLIGRTIIAGTEYNLGFATEVDLSLVNMGREMVQLLGFSPITKRTYIKCPG